MSYTKKAVRGTAITFIIGILAAMIMYLFRIYVARTLGAEQYGLFHAVFTFVIFFLFFRDLGLGTSLVKHIVEFKTKQQQDKIKTAIISVISFQLIGSLILGIIFFFLSDVLAQHYFKNPQAAAMLNLFILYIFGSIFFIVLKGIFRGFQNMLLYSSVEFVKNVIVFVLTFLLIQKGYNLFAPAIAYVIVSFVLFLLYLPLALKQFPFFKHKITEFNTTSKSVILFGIPLFATSMADKVIGYMDTLFLTHFRSLTEVGIYNAILPSSLILLYFGFAIGATIFPIIAELWAKKEFIRLQKSVHLLYKYLFVLLIPATLTVFVYSSFLINLLFGAEFVAGSTALQILVIGVLFFVLALVNNNIISAIGYPKIIAKITLFAAGLNLILNLVLIPSLGINGAALATAISYLCSLLLSLRYVKHKFKLALPISAWVRQTISAGIFVGTLYFFKLQLPNIFALSLPVTFIISIILSTIIFVAVLFLLKAIDIKEIKKQLKLMK